MVNKRRGNKQGVKVAVIDLKVVSSRLMDLEHVVMLHSCTDSHWQIRYKYKVLLDLWPTTGRF